LLSKHEGNIREQFLDLEKVDLHFKIIVQPLFQERYRPDSFRVFCCSYQRSDHFHSVAIQTGIDSGWLNTSAVALAVSGTNLFAGTNSGTGVFLSTNNGTSWTAVNTGLTNTTVNALAISGTNLFAGTLGGVFLSTNNGNSWTSVGLATTYVYSFAVSATHLFAGTYGGGVWRRPLSEMVTPVESYSIEMPTQFSLEQNYPNPFNPTTAISYQLSAVSVVTLTVYDILGREIAKLVDGKQQAGVHTVRWDASLFPSGVYSYRLQARQTDGGRAGQFTQTKKLVLAR
jgi:hypothetical protein